MAGTAPKGLTFVANARIIWLVKWARPEMGGGDAGRPGPVFQQACLGDFCIPQRGVPTVGNAASEALEPGCHSTAVSGPQAPTGLRHFRN